jgi:putative addiction module component (TIGR02574 family)
MAHPEIDISNLTVKERLELIARLMESIAEYELPDSPAFELELARRIADADQDPDGGVDAFEFIAQLRQRLS